MKELPADIVEEAIEACLAAEAKWRKAREVLENHPDRSLRLALGVSYQAHQVSEGVTPNARKKIRSAMRMCAAELGLDHT